MRRILTLFLAVFLTLGALSGCAKEDPSLSVDRGQYALAAYPPDTVVMTIDGSEVHWNEFAFWLCSAAKQMAEEAGVSEIEDWDAVYDETSGETWAEHLISGVLQQEKEFHCLEAKAAGYGLALGADGDAYVEQSVYEALERLNISPEEADADALKPYYLDTDVLRYQAKISYLYLMMYQELFGADGEKLTDEELNDNIAQNGYMTVRHILLSTVDEANNPLPDEVKEQKHTQAARIIERLRNITDTEELLREFDRYAAEFNEDPGVQMYPNGYCFTAGRMDAAFEAASAALQPYEVSPEPVESAYGWHVILRLPTTGEDVVDINSDGTPYLLRADAAQATYTALVHAWISDAKVEWAEGFEDLDVGKLFSKPESGWEKLDVFHWFHK